MNRSDARANRGAGIDERAVSIVSVGGGYELIARDVLPHPIDRVFTFFSDPFNLEKLTPRFLRFSIVTPPPIEMREGALIDYRLRVHGLPIRWRSRITAWEPGVRFVDEQVRGPYHRWVHEHRFSEHPGGTLVEDRVSYKPRGGCLVHAVFVKRDLERIFRHRLEATPRCIAEG